MASNSYIGGGKASGKNKKTTITFTFRNRRWKDIGRGLDAFAKSHKTAYKAVGAKVIADHLGRYLRTAARAMQMRHGRPYPTGTSAQTLSVRSGLGMRSIADSVRVKTSNTPDKVMGFIGGMSYLKTHEFGGVLRPVRASALTVPLPPALKADGTPKRESARHWPNTFIYTSKNGHRLIAHLVDDQLENLYVLKDEVRIPPRLGLHDTLISHKTTFIDRVMLDWYRGVLRKM